MSSSEVVTKLYNNISEEIDQFNKNAEKAVAGNKAAAARSRKSTQVLTKLFKEWRKSTISEMTEKKE